jgi:ribonuclease J
VGRRRRPRATQPARQVKDAGEFDCINRLQPHRIFPEQLAEHRDRLVLLFRGSMTRELDVAGCLDGAACVWSMWPGYLDKPSGERLQAWRGRRGIALSVAHASGHATVTDLQRLATAVDARRVVPVHTAHPELFPSLFERVDPAVDGQWWSV